MDTMMTLDVSRSVVSVKSDELNLPSDHDSR